MTTGTVTTDREIVIELAAVAADQSPVNLKAVVDTGFNGYLTLSSETLDHLNSAPAGTRRAELGDGNIVEMEVHLVSVLWNGIVREILALQAESTPLIGMSLLWGSQVRFDAREGGGVSIDDLSDGPGADA